MLTEHGSLLVLVEMGGCAQGQVQRKHVGGGKQSLHDMILDGLVLLSCGALLMWCKFCHYAGGFLLMLLWMSCLRAPSFSDAGE